MAEKTSILRNPELATSDMSPYASAKMAPGEEALTLGLIKGPRGVEDVRQWE